MSSQTQEQRHIRAKLGSKVLGKSAEFFSQSFRTIIAELLQNARRARAAQVDITVNALDNDLVDVTISDNGEGITDPQILLTFGESQWDEHTDVAENAAGMGFYSLASRGCTIQSQTWQCSISPDAFIGKADVAVEQHEPIVGTRILFQIKGSLSDIVDTIKSATECYPIIATLNGERLPQRDFLEKAAYIKEALGLRFGVIVDTRHPYDRITMNFFGHQIRTDNISAIVEAVPRLTERMTHSWVRPDARRYIVLVDVVDAPDLRLVLPDRREIIKNDFWLLIKAEGERAIFEHLANDPYHQLSHKDIVRARELGITISDPTFVPFLWQAKPAAGYEEMNHSLTTSDGQDRILLPHNQSPVVRMPNFHSTLTNVTLHTALVNLSSAPVVLIENSYAGFPEFEELPIVESISYRVTTNAQTFMVAQDEDDQDNESAKTMFQRLGIKARGCAVDELAIVLHIEDGSEIATIPASEAVFSGWDTWSDDHLLFAAIKTATTSDVEDLLMAALFCASDDACSDSVDTQRDDAERSIRNVVADSLRDKYDSALVKLEEYVSGIRFDLKHCDIRSVVLESVDDKTTVTYTFTDGTIRTK